MFAEIMSPDPKTCFIIGILLGTTLGMMIGLLIAFLTIK
jgi:hypothetical protein